MNLNATCLLSHPRAREKAQPASNRENRLQCTAHCSLNHPPTGHNISEAVASIKTFFFFFFFSKEKNGIKTGVSHILHRYYFVRFVFQPYVFMDTYMCMM